MAARRPVAICALRTAARASSSRPGSRDRLRKAGAGSPAICGVERDRRLRLAQGLRVGRPAGTVGQALADPDHELGQLDALVAELGLVPSVLEHLAGGFEGRRPGPARDR